MADALAQEKQESVGKHVEAGEKSGSGSETEDHLAGLNDTNVRCFVREHVKRQF